MTSTRKPRRSADEIVRLGREMYARDIRPLVKDDHFGEYVAIDVESGDWAIAESERGASERLRAKRPDAVNILMERVGFRGLRRFGAGVPWMEE